MYQSNGTEKEKMKIFFVTFVKRGELYQCVVTADTADAARKFVANEEGIPTHFEITGCYYNNFLENNHVSSVVEIAA